ncbi:MAG: helix-turn-helix domain-containing protein [Bacteroides sp.]|nr:helix-turn-helix domain-containing protein [Bacteroides sp.]MCM1550650.1 helix-turn-helix domain-containing protein [Clostridium sp.]
MKEINLGRILLENRRKRGVTQEELAAYMGVSKASVSKWETETTYPDITLLPRLAAYFNISIDALMGYEPQMTREDIQNLYGQLSRDFSEQPFDAVMERCHRLVKHYFSCYPLLFQMGALYVNHAEFAGTPERISGIYEEAKDLFVRVKKESDDAELASQAVSMEAFCLLRLGRLQEVLELLEPLEINPLSPEPLLASAYQMAGREKEARMILQSGIYQTMLHLLNLLMTYMDVCKDNVTACEETYRRAMAIVEAFSVSDLHPGNLLSFYIVAAQSFLALGNQERTFVILEQYTELVLSGSHSLQLHGDSYFDLLNEWLETNLLMGSALPRDETIVRRSMIEAIRDNPAFSTLKDIPRFQMLLRRLTAGEEKKE